jgi:hypothetical protein
MRLPASPSSSWNERRAVGARPSRRPRPEPNWRRYLGPPNSWRRVVLAGIGGGVALAVFAALLVAFVGGGGGGSLAPNATLVPISSGGNVGAPTSEPVVDTPTAELPTEAATPVSTEPAPTETAAPAEPTETPAAEVPTAVLTP